MRCPQCGGYSFDSEDRCLNCGYKISFNAKPPSWWSSPGQRKRVSTNETPGKGAVDLQPPKLGICPRCHERSLFHNDRDGVYECLNRRCKAKAKSLEDLQPKPQLKTKNVPQMAKPTQRVFPKTGSSSIATGVFDTWLRSNAGRLLRRWKWHRPHRLKVTRRGLSTFWGLFKKTVISVSLLTVTAVIISSVSLIISGTIGIAGGVIIAGLGLVLSIWCTNSVSFRRVSFSRFFMIVVISVIFIMAATAYLDIKSLNDVRDSIVGALSIAK